MLGSDFYHLDDERIKREKARLGEESHARERHKASNGIKVSLTRTARILHYSFVVCGDFPPFHSFT